MSEPKQQQPKILLHKPKKSQRSSPGVSTTDSTSCDGAGGARSVSTASSTSSPAPPNAKKPIWYRFRTALMTLLVVNAVLVGYTLFRTSFKPSEPSQEAESTEKNIKESEEKEKAESEDNKIETPELSKSEVAKASNSVVAELSKMTPATVFPQQMNLQEAKRPKLSDEEQQELFNWMLAEKRKAKPTTKAEKAQIDAEKALLKEFLRGKNVLNF